MSTADRVLAVKLVSDVGSISKDLKGVQGKFKGMAASAKSWGKAFTGALAIEGVQKLTGAIEDGVTGFKSGRLLADQLGVSWRNMGFDGDKLASTLQQVTDSTLALGTSDDEAVKAFTNSLKWTKSYNSSLKDLTIAQDLVANGSAPNLAAAFKIIQRVGAGSKGALDKFGVSGKTAGERIHNLGQKVKGAAKHAAKGTPFAVGMNAISEAFETIAGSTIVPIMTDLGKALKDTVAPAVTALSNAIGQSDASGLAARIIAVSVAAGILAVVLWANPIMLVVAAVIALSLAIGALIVWWDALPAKAVIANVAVASVGAGFKMLGDFLSLTFMPLVSPIFDTLLGVWKVAQGLITLDLQTFVDGLVSIATGAVGTILAPFKLIWDVIKAGFNLVGIDIGNAMQGAMDWVTGGIRAALGIIVDLVNNMIDGVNLLLGALGREQIGHIKLGKGTPAAVDLGKGPSHHASGTSNARRGLAWVGERGKELVDFHGGERVIPHGRSMAMAGGTNNVTYNITVNAPPLTDPAAIGKTVVGYIQQYERRDGGVWRRGR